MERGARSEFLQRRIIDAQREELADQNEHLDSALQASLTEVHRQADELRASRVRIVTVADDARRRIELWPSGRSRSPSARPRRGGSRGKRGLSMPDDTARHEARMRRLAQRQGLRLTKSRVDGTFMIVDPYTNGVVATTPYANARPFANGLSLEDVEDWLEQPEQ